MIDIPPDAVRRAILLSVADGAQPLGAVVASAEAAVADPASARIAATLQEMAREGRIRLSNDGRRWWVAQAGPQKRLRLLCLAGGLRRLRRRLAPQTAAAV